MAAATSKSQTLADSLASWAAAPAEEVGAPAARSSEPPAAASGSLPSKVEGKSEAKRRYRALRLPLNGEAKITKATAVFVTSVSRRLQRRLQRAREKADKARLSELGLKRVLSEPVLPSQKLLSSCLLEDSGDITASGDAVLFSPVPRSRAVTDGSTFSQEKKKKKSARSGETSEESDGSKESEEGEESEEGSEDSSESEDMDEATSLAVGVQRRAAEQLLFAQLNQLAAKQKLRYGSDHELNGQENRVKTGNLARDFTQLHSDTIGILEAYATLSPPRRRHSFDMNALSTPILSPQQSFQRGFNMTPKDSLRRSLRSALSLRSDGTRRGDPASPIGN